MNGEAKRVVPRAISQRLMKEENGSGKRPGAQYPASRGISMLMLSETMSQRCDQTAAGTLTSFH